MSRIALFHPEFVVPGGAEFLCVQHARELSERGHQVKVVTFSVDMDRWRDEFGGIEVVSLPKRSWAEPLVAWDRVKKTRSRARRAGKHLRDVDVVIAHNAPCNSMLGSLDLAAVQIWQCNEPPRTTHFELANPALAARAAGAPRADEDFATLDARAALSERLGSGSEAAKRARVAKADIAATQRLDEIYAISEHSRGTARAIYGRCHDRVVYPSVRFPEGERKQGPVSKDGLQLLVHTRLTVLKNVDTVLRGFAAFREQDSAAVLHIVGDGPVRGRLEELATLLLPDDAYAFHGYLSREDLARVYGRCDALALLTIDEPFGMVYPEAAARGLLLIGPDHGGPREILEDGDIGHCVNAFEPAALVEALAEVRAMSTQDVDARRERADTSCRARFSKEAVHAELHGILHGATAGAV